MSKELSIIEFNNDQIKLIQSQVAPQATENELALFLYQAKRTGLDPLTRQIYCIHRNIKTPEGNWIKKMTIQTSIDGFRVIAERSGDYAGQDEPIFIEDNTGLVSCKITVYRFRGETRYPAAVGVAYWSEYFQADKVGAPSGLWKKMPHCMLAKVAEALALRKAYPQDLSGLYTSDEMSQSDLEANNQEEAKSKFFKKDAEKIEISAEEKREAAEIYFKKTKADFEGCGSLSELEAMEKKETKGLKALAKYPDLHQMITEAIDATKLSFVAE